MSHHRPPRSTTNRETYAGWVAIGAFGFLLAATQVLWLTYAPITSQAHQVLGVSEGAVGDLAVVVPVLFVILGIPCGRWLDRRFTTTLAIGTTLTAAGALIRAADHDSYAYALTGQIVLAAGQPLLLSAITKLPARHLPPEMRVAGISFLTAAQVLGILVAAAGGLWLYDRGGLGLLVGTHAALAVIAAAAMLLSLRIRPRFAVEVERPERFSLAGRRELKILAAQAFIGLGLFNSLATWLDSIESGLGNNGLGGVMVTVMTVAGIAGAAILPSLASRRRARRSMLIVIAIGSTLISPLLIVFTDPVAATIVVGVGGFLLIAGLPIALDWSEVMVGADHAAAAAAFILVIANLGGSIYVLVLRLAIDDPIRTLLTMTLLVAPWIALARLKAPDSAPAETGAHH